MSLLLRTLPASIVLFAVPTVVILLALIGVELLGLWPLNGTRSTGGLDVVFAILSVVAGLLAAAAAYAIQRRVAASARSLTGHVLVCWPVYLGVGWLALNWFAIPGSPESPKPSGAHLWLASLFTLSQGVGLASHLGIMLVRRKTRDEPRKPGSERESTTAM